MRRISCYIAVMLTVCAMALSCGRKARVIPVDKMADICAEMFLADQWIVIGGLATQSDTHFVYRPIFEKYGYTADDYRLSVQTYLQDPEKYAKVFTKVKDGFNERLVVINKRDSVKTKRDSALRADRLRWEKVPVPVLYKDILVGQFPSDTVCPGPDSLRYTINVPVLDTMFFGPKIVLRNDGVAEGQTDTTGVEAVADTIQVLRENEAAPLPGRVPAINQRLNHDARRPGLRTDNQQEIGRLPRRKPAATEGKAL